MVIKLLNRETRIRFCGLNDLTSTWPTQAYVVADENVQDLHGAAWSDYNTITVPPGEESKSWEETGRIVRELIREGADRRSAVVALGGGVVGDLAGFAAAVLMRGINLIQVPTTLLAMVDSSVGGKTGIDLPEGKNLAGSFWPAAEVTVVPEVLKTLPKSQWLNGSAEVWKYGAIMDRAFFEELEGSPISGDLDQAERIVRKCIELKADVVQKDEFETTGLRAILNFGHTVGHSIEWAQNYQGLAHGEAVSVGMVAEARLGEELKITPAGTAERLRRALKMQGLPVDVPTELDPQELIQAMRRDKKAVDGGLAFSLLEDLGACKLFRDVSSDEVCKVLTAP
jgi:3-dehydroquinate synthase